MWGDLIDKYGLAIAFLAVVLFGVWKWLVPLINKMLETLNRQLEENRAARELERKDFLAALREVTQEHKNTVTTIAQSVDGIRDELRRHK